MSMWIMERVGMRLFNQVEGVESTLGKTPLGKKVLDEIWIFLLKYIF